MEHNVGDTVDFLGMKATIRYLGDYHLKPGKWVGLELDKPKGKNNGTIRGKEYFACEPNYGLFISHDHFVRHLGAKKKRPSPSQSVDQLPAVEKPPLAHSVSAGTVLLEDKSDEVQDEFARKLEEAKKKYADIERAIRTEAKVIKELQAKVQGVQKEHDKKAGDMQNWHSTKQSTHLSYSGSKKTSRSSQQTSASNCDAQKRVNRGGSNNMSVYCVRLFCPNR